MSSADGSYSLSNLPVGPYRLEASAAGFKTHVQEGILLQVNSNPVINVQVEVGQVTQEVQVTASAAMAETQANSISQVIDNKRVLELPLNGRDATHLVLLSGAAAGRDNNFNGLGGDRANVVGDSHVEEPTLDRWFNTAACAHASNGAYGNAGRFSLQALEPSRWMLL